MYILRRGGTSEFVSEIIPGRWGDVIFVPGWEHPDRLTFTEAYLAEATAQTVEDIDGCTISIEEVEE